MRAGSDGALVIVAAVVASLAGWFAAAEVPSASKRLRGAADRDRLAWHRVLRVGQRRRLSPSALGRVGASAAAVLAAITTGPIPAVVAVGAAFVLIRRRRAARRARDALREQAEDVPALRALAAELRSGLAPAAALRAASGSPSAPAQPGGIRRRMRAAAAADALGGDPAVVLAATSDPGSPAAALGAAWGVCRRTGASLAAPVSRIADGAAGQLRIARETDAALAAARSSARLLAALPFAGVALGGLSGAGSVRVLLTTGLGQLCLLVGVALDLAGLGWLDRLARGAGS